MLDELLRVSVRRVRQDHFDARRHLRLGQEVAHEMQREPVIDDVTGNDRMTTVAQYGRNRTAPGGRLPDSMRKALDAQERMHGFGRCLIKIIAAILEGMAARIGGVAEPLAIA
jgi:hypothetical protein